MVRMKKISRMSTNIPLILLVVLGMSMSYSVHADPVETILIDESFESGMPTTWENTGWLDSYYPAENAAHTGSHWGYSWGKGDTLTTPEKQFGLDTSLTFWYRAEKESNPMELLVYIDDVNTLLWSDSGFSHTTYEQVTLNLSAYTGTHQILFYSNTSDTYGQLIDDIRLTSYLEETDDPSDGGSGDGGGGTGGVPPAENIAPTADLSNGEPYTGFTNGSIFFDATLSSDSDGSIDKWFWDFGDDSTKPGETVYHTYETEGIYTVSLTVVDDQGASDTDTTVVTIQKGNNPPDKPRIWQPSSESLEEESVFILKNKSGVASFMISSRDVDGDMMTFTVDWGDGTIDTSDDNPSDVSVNVTHSWAIQGRYDVSVIATDGDDAESEETTIVVFINIAVLPVSGDLTGYLFSDEATDEYEFFYHEGLGIETETEKDDQGQYLIDSDGDNQWDYVYNTTAGLTIYESEKEPVKEESTETSTPGFIVIGVLCAIIVVALLRRKQR